MTFERGIIRSAKLYSLKRFFVYTASSSQDIAKKTLLITDLFQKLWTSDPESYPSNLFKYKKTLNSYISVIDRDEKKKKKTSLNDSRFPLYFELVSSSKFSLSSHDFFLINLYKKIFRSFSYVDQ